MCVEGIQIGVIMRNKNIGKMIHTLRTHHQVSQERLAKGLCSIPSLSRFETCARIPDKLLLDALLQRLGKSSDKLEVIMTVADYDLYMHREKIEESIVEEDYKAARELLDEYAKNREAREPVHKQYILKIMAVLCELDDKDIEMSQEYIEKAIRITMPEGEEEALEKFLLSKAEIQLILMKIYHCNIEESKKALDLLEKINHYVKTHYTDEEELVKIHAKTVRVEAKILLERKEYERAVEVCESALELLGKNDVLLDFYEILLMLIKGLECIDRQSDKLRKIIKWKETLSNLYEEYKVRIPEGIMELLMENSQCEILLISEIIKKERKMKGLSQEALSENICTPENLSAIENGKRAPTVKNYDKLIEKLGIDKDYYNTILSTETFEVQELRRECSRLIYHREYDKAEPLLEKIGELIDISIPVNKQYLFFNRTLLQYNKGEISKVEALKRAIHALEMTFEYKGSNFRTDSNPLQEEVRILNFICIIYKHLGKTQKAIRVYKKILQSYEASKVSIKGHYVGSNLIMANLCIDLEEVNEIEESIEISHKGIKQALKCGRGTMIPVFLINRACCMEKMGDKKACMKYLQQAFYISDMMKNEYTKDITNKYYVKQYGKIEWD